MGQNRRFLRCMANFLPLRACRRACMASFVPLRACQCACMASFVPVWACQGACWASFVPVRACRRAVLGEFCTEGHPSACVQGEFCPGLRPKRGPSGKCCEVEVAGLIAARHCHIWPGGGPAIPALVPASYRRGQPWPVSVRYTRNRFSATMTAAIRKPVRRRGRLFA